MQHLAAVLLPAAAVTPALYLKVVPGCPSPPLVFSISWTHKLLSAVITTVHSGWAGGSQPVATHRLRLPGHWADMSEGSGPEHAPSRHTADSSAARRPLGGVGVNEND